MTIVAEDFTSEQTAAAGGDWAGYGPVIGQQLIALMQQGQIGVVFADKGLVVCVETAGGQKGIYNLVHQKDF